MSYSQLVKSAGKRKMNPKAPPRPSTTSTSRSNARTQAPDPAKSGVSPFRDRPSSFLRRNGRDQSDEQVDRSASAPVKRPSLLSRTLSGASVSNKGSTESEEPTSAPTHKRPGLLSRKPRSSSNVKENEEVRSPQPTTHNEPPRSASARRPSNNANTPSHTPARKMSTTSIHSRTTPVRESHDSARAASMNRVSSARGITPQREQSTRISSDSHVEGATPEQIITSLRKRLHDTDRLITACQGKITEYQTKLAMFRAEKLELEMKLSKQESVLKKVKFPRDSKVQVNLSFDAYNPVWAEATVIEHDQVNGTFVLVVENFGEVDSVPEDKVRHLALAQENEKIYEFDDDSLPVGSNVEINTGVDPETGKKSWSAGTVHRVNSNNTYDIMIEKHGIVEEVPREGLRVA